MYYNTHPEWVTVRNEGNLLFFLLHEQRKTELYRLC